jgi:hypothetical protein
MHIQAFLWQAPPEEAQLEITVRRAVRGLLVINKKLPRNELFAAKLTIFEV